MSFRVRFLCRTGAGVVHLNIPEGLSGLAKAREVDSGLEADELQSGVRRVLLHEDPWYSHDTRTTLEVLHGEVTTSSLSCVVTEEEARASGLFQNKDHADVSVPAGALNGFAEIYLSFSCPREWMLRVHKGDLAEAWCQAGFPRSWDPGVQSREGTPQCDATTSTSGPSGVLP